MCSIYEAMSTIVSSRGGLSRIRGIVYVEDGTRLILGVPRCSILISNYFGSIGQDSFRFAMCSLEGR